MIKFARSVGTAPGTTVIVPYSKGARALGVHQCRPVPLPIHQVPDQSRVTIPSTPIEAEVYDPYASPTDLKTNGLGIVLTPWEYTRTLATKGPKLAPFDPLYNMRGEQGFYYDSRLGAIPTDAEFAPDVCYTPVKSGWITTEEGYVPPPWRPGGYRPVAPEYGPTGLDGAVAQLGDVADQLEIHQRRMFYLSIFSTIAVVAVAVTTVIRAARDRD